MQLEFSTDTLAEEVARLKRERDNGTHCRACGHYVKMYKRRIHTTVAVSLIALYRMGLKRPDEFIHTIEVSKFHELCINGRTELPRAAVWGLIEGKDVPVEDLNGGKTSGLWRITPRGRDFVLGRLQIPRHAYCYNDGVYGFSDELVSIKDCLGRNFDYQALMDGTL